MDLSSLSDEELTQNLRSAPRSLVRGADVRKEEMDELVRELHVHRVELEMQNRALREAEVEIETALQRYCDLYDHLPIGYVTLTPKGQIVHANLTAAAWLRRDREKLVGGFLHWFLDAFDAGRLAAHLANCVQSATAQTLEVTLRPETGLLLTVELSSRPAPADGQTEPQIQTAIASISRLKQAHVVAQDIDREQETFSQSIAQHVRTPLATISNFARNILHDHATELSSELKGMIERMEYAAVRMEATLQHLLEYCSLGHEDIDLDPVNLEELMQQVIMEHRTVFQRHGTELTVDRPLPCVRGARLLLAQVLGNVLTNMLKHGTPRIRVTAQQIDQEVVLKIEGETHPLNPPQEEQNFRLFERRHEKDCYWSAGIGLTLVRRTIERMHGRVWVESSVDQTIFFNVGLPAV